MMDIQVLRSWPGVTNGQRLTLGESRARRLIASGMAAAHPAPVRPRAAPGLPPAVPVARKRRYAPAQQKAKK